MRGSDPDAAVYSLAAMLKAGEGEDPRFLARRMVVLASHRRFPAQRTLREREHAQPQRGRRLPARPPAGFDGGGDHLPELLRGRSYERPPG